MKGFYVDLAVRSSFNLNGVLKLIQFLFQVKFSDFLARFFLARYSETSPIFISVEKVIPFTAI